MGAVAGTARRSRISRGWAAAVPEVGLGWVATTTGLAGDLAGTPTSRAWLRDDAVTPDRYFSSRGGRCPVELQRPADHQGAGVARRLLDPVRSGPSETGRPPHPTTSSTCRGTAALITSASGSSPKPRSARAAGRWRYRGPRPRPVHPGLHAAGARGDLDLRRRGRRPGASVGLRALSARLIR